MSATEAILGMLLVISVGLLTRRSIRRQVAAPPREVADSPSACAPLLGVVPPPRTEQPLDAKIIHP